MIQSWVIRHTILGAAAAVAVCLSGASYGSDSVSAADGPKPLRTDVTKLRDVRLAEGGVMHLQLLTEDGQPIRNADVELQFGSRKVATGQTDDAGVVEFSNLRPGIHRIQAGAGSESVRLWNQDTAPPAAVNRVAIVADEDVVRGQLGIFTPDPNAPPQTQGYTFGGQLLDPLMLAAIGLGVYATAEVIELNGDVDALNRNLAQALASP